MQKDQLRESLKNLHGELRNTECLDDSSKERIDKLMDDVERILEHAGDAPLRHHRNLMESLRESTEHFEVSHPTLTAVMNNVMNALSNIGI